MRRRLAAGLGLVAALALAFGHGTGPAPAQAEGEARCLVLGPLVVSSYVSLLESVAERARDAAAERAASTAALVDLHDRLGCPMPPLTEAVECLSAALVAGDTARPVAETAEACMRDAGMPVR